MKRYHIEQIIINSYTGDFEDHRVVYESDDMQQVLDLWGEVFSGASTSFDRQNFSEAIFYRIVDTL